MDFFQFLYDRIVENLVPELAAILLFILAIATRWSAGLSQACLAAGRTLSSQSSGTGYQDALTPPWSVNLFFIEWGLTILILVLSFISFEFLVGASLLLFFVIITLLSGVFVIPKPESRHFLQIIFHSICSRLADYRRDGDEDRENAANILRDGFLEKYRNILLTRD